MVHVSRPDTLAGLQVALASLQREVGLLRTDNNKLLLAIAGHSEKTSSVLVRAEWDGLNVKIKEAPVLTVKTEVPA